MAANTSFSDKDLICPQCFEIYHLPVLLKCSHNFCRVCLQKFWKGKGCRECPVCHTVYVPERPPINLALKLAADEYRKRMSRGNQDVCGIHNEELKIFCNNDEEPICLVCQLSKQHKVHDCSPVEEAAQQKKKEISATLESMKKKLNTMKKTKEQWEETKSYIQIQVCQTELAIREEFDKLHSFLREEEKTRVNVLKQEGEKKIQVMSMKLKNIQDQMKTLSFTISHIETALTAKDLPFLKDYKQTMKRVKSNVQEPQCVRDILIDSAKHLGLLKFEILKEMANVVKYVPLSLDPNTAHSNLKLSQGLTCVQYSSRQPLPDNPERCTSHMSVLGATGFKCGKHSWTVEVGHSKDWYIGVAQESIQRKSTTFLVPTEGYWVIGLCKGVWAPTSPPIKLVMGPKPKKITIKVNYDKGKVVFINAFDLTIIHTFKDKFTEKIFPYFSPGLCKDGQNPNPLTICPLTIKVDVE